MSNPICLVEPVEVALSHNAWANANLIDACDPLPAAQLDQSFDMGLGSLRATITHVFGAMRSWSDFLAKRGVRERLEPSASVGVPEWRAMLPELDRDLRDAALSGPMDEVIVAERGGHSYSFVRSHAILHVTTHGVHHRAQCQNMLRHLGVSDLPQSSGMHWGMAQMPAG